MKKIAVVVLMLMCLSLFSEARKEPHAIGFGAGELSRHGVTYRYWGESIGFHVTAMLLANDDGVADHYDYTSGTYPDLDYYGYGRKFRSNLGLEVMKIIKENQLSKFYGFIGYGFYHKEEKVWVSNYPGMNYSYDNFYKVQNDHYFGIGLGVDFDMLEYLRGYIEIPLTFKSNGEINMYIPQAGILYKF